MKTKTMKITGILLTLVMLVTMLGMFSLTVSAAEGDKVSVTINGETTYYTSIKDAVAKANESGNATITLLQDTITGERLDITKSATLDLNGKTLSCATNFSDDYDTMVAVTTDGAKLTIIDSIGGGKLDGTGTTFVLYLGDPSWQGSVTFTSSAQISGGTVSGGVRMRGGTSMTVSGGTLENNTDGLATIEMQSETTLNVSGGEILNTAFAGDAISNMDGGTVIISGGTVNASGDYARAIRTQNSGGVEISGGNIFGAQYDLSFASDDTVELTGGIFPGGITVYGKTLNESLGNGFSYWAVVGGQNTMLTVATDATGITDKGDITIRAICDHSGNTNDYTDNGDGTHDATCTACGAVVVDNEAHTGGKATCTEKAVCESCGTSYGNIDENAHAWNDGVVTTDPTCSTVGTKTFTCTHNSEHTKTEDVAIDENAHAWNSGVVTTNPTCSTVGTKTFTCTHNSAHTYTEDVDALGHKHDNACDSDCNTCGEARTPAEHYSENADGKCDECGESFELSGGAIAGIVIAAVAVLGGGGFALFWFVIKKKKWSDLFPR